MISLQNVILTQKLYVAVGTIHPLETTKK